MRVEQDAIPVKSAAAIPITLGITLERAALPIRSRPAVRIALDRE